MIAQLSSDSAVEAPRCGVTIQPFAPTVVVFGKSDTYLCTFPAASASTIASSSTSRSLAKFNMIAVGFIIAIASALIIFFVESRSGTWIVM